MYYTTFIFLRRKVYESFSCTFCIIVCQVYSIMYETTKRLDTFLCKLSLAIAFVAVILKIEGNEECSFILFA